MEVQSGGIGAEGFTSQMCCTYGTNPQEPFAVAVVIPTVLRASLARAVRSVFRQQFRGRIQILVGIDHVLGDRTILEELRRECPAHCAMTVLDLGYSTSRRHGGAYLSCDGGALRTVLSYCANSPRIAYLDDDNWFGENHLETLRQALVNHDWAFSLRWYVDADTACPLCVDEWESVGPEAGFYKDRFGGFVDPNCLMIDKLRCDPVLRYWCTPLKNDRTGMSADRNIFRQLSDNFRASCSGQATSFYLLQKQDRAHEQRLRWIQKKLSNTSDPSKLWTPGMCQ